MTFVWIVEKPWLIKEPECIIVSKFCYLSLIFFRAHLAINVLELLFRTPYNYFVRAKCNDKLADFQADLSVYY